MVIELLKSHGAKLIYLFGSRARDAVRADSDWDFAALFDGDVDEALINGHLPAGVDVLVLDRAPLELAGRVAMEGRLLFEADPPLRVRWEATTRKIYLDERPRVEQARKDFVAGVEARGRR